jgi:hypothetical protein
MRHTFILIAVLIFLLLCCTKHDYNPRLVDYLKAAKDLSARVTQENGLDDSTRVLQKKYKIDLEKELTRLHDNPQAWLTLFEEMHGEK